MQSSNLRYQTGLYASYLLSTNLKNLSSIKPDRELEIPQASAWHLAQRIRRAWNLDTEEPFEGPVEADETYMESLCDSHSQEDPLPIHPPADQPEREPHHHRLEGGLIGGSPELEDVLPQVCPQGCCGPTG